MSSVDPQVEALIRAGLKQESAPQPPQQMVVKVTTEEGTQEVPLPLAMVIILDKILDELIAIRRVLDPNAPSGMSEPQP